MSSFAFSLAFSTPEKQNTGSSSSSRLVLKNLERADSQPATRIGAHTHLNNAVPQTVTLLQANENPNLLGRREAIVTGVSVCMLGFLMQPQLAAADEGPPCEFTVSPSGLAFCDKIVGFGAQPAAGQLIKAHYVGKLENGKVFDSSYGRGKPLTFRVGVGQVIKGWDQGILGTDGVPPMLAGGKRTLRIPPELGYGMRGAGCRGGTCIIPPDSVLFFDVEFIGKA